MLIPKDDFHAIDRLQESNLNLQAYERSKPFGPLNEWEGTGELLLASHLAYSLGAPELSFRLTSRAWHKDKQDPKAVFYYAIELLQRRGPLPALLFMRKYPDFVADDKLMSWWFSLHGQLHSTLRDFTVADDWIGKAAEACPTEPWVWVSRAFSLEQQDRYEDALASARKGLELGPHRRATVSSTAYYLTLLERNDEAAALLSRTIEKVENAWLVKTLADLQTEMGRHREAHETLQRCFELLPLLEPKVAQWFYGGLSDSAYMIGDMDRAVEYAEKADNPFHKKIVENLKHAPPDAGRVQLDVRFLRQHHVTCAPATLSNLGRFWKKRADHLELVEEMCYDGTPSYKERIWAESNGWVTKEFTLNWDDAIALLDRGVPLTLATVYPGGGHLQALIGYDARRRTYLVRDPYYEKTGEFLADELVESQKASGPRVMALAPESSGDLITGLNRELLDAPIYDLFFKVESSLEVHKRDEAEAALKALRQQHPEHRLTHVARWAVSNYDSNPLGIRAALRGLLRQFPDDVNLRLNDISVSAEVTGRAERLETLERYATTKPTDPLIWQMFGYELGLDAKQRRRSLHWLFRSVRNAPGNALTYRFLGDGLWAQRRFEEAAELYRFAASLNDKDEQIAYTYFLAMRHLRREDEALDVMSDRFRRFGKRSSQPVFSFVSALRELGRVEEGFKVLDDAIRLRPADGDLLVFAADANARYGRTEKADELLHKARGNTPVSKWLRTAARIAQLRGDLEGALAKWREVLEDDPSATDAHENIAFLIKGLEGSTAAKEHLRRACRRFPTNRSLQVLRLQHLTEEPGEAIAVLRDLISLDPGDVWSLRELSSWYAQLGRFDRALEAADKAVAVDPNDTVSRWFRGRALEFLGRYSDAADEYRTAIRLSVDNTYAISGLVSTARSVEAKRETLAFVRDQLERQPSTGDGLFAYRDEARAVIDRDSVLEQLREYHSANRRSWFAASAVIQQLAEMGRSDEAERLAIEATERFPLNGQSWSDLALVYKLIGNIDREIDALRNAVSVDPVWSYGVQHLADAYERAGRFEEERDLLIEALTRMPFDNFLMGYLAGAYWHLGERAKAIETAKQAVMIEPEYQWAWSAIKNWAEQTGDHDLPAQLARELTQKKPKDIRAWVNLATMLDNGAFSQERLDALEQALRIDPYSPPALAAKANALADARRFDEAIAVAKTQMPDGHRPEQLCFVESGIESMRGNNRRSIDILIELTERSPGYMPAWLRLADFYRSDPERRHEYRKVAMQLARLAPREATAFGYLAEANLNLELEDEARDALQQAVILDPNYEYAVMTLFDLLVKKNDLDAAGRLVETVRGSSRVNGLPISVEFAVRKGDRDEVIRWLRELLENQDVSRERLDRALEKAASYLGRKDDRLAAVIREACLSGRANPVVGRYLVDAGWEADKLRGAEKAVDSVTDVPGVWAHAASRLMEILAVEKPRRLRTFIDSNAEKLAAETESWGAVGYQLTRLDDLGRIEKWFADWRSRSDLMPWMLWNYSVLLRRGRKSDEADAVNSAALQLRYDDTVNLHLTTLGLSEFCRGNFDSAAAIFSGINPSVMSDWDRFFYDVLNEAVWAHDRIAAADIDAAKALVDSIVDKIIAFDPNNTDHMVNDLAGKAVNMLLKEIGSTWYTILKKGKLLYYRFG